MLLLGIFFISIPIGMFAQNISVKGNVKDTTGEPIVGATIMEKGTSNGVISDLDGNFTIQVAPDATLHISYIGYAEKDVPVEGKHEISVLLSEDNEVLDEVVVIGYGTVKRRDLTGAVASVKGEELTANPVSNVTEALQGRLPGVNVTSQDGRPGATISVRVRGGGSITQSNEPLYIVDGFPVSGISDIPASEIESIDVLKDASSTAIYGARGANGVILVTTKSAKEGRIKVSYDGYVQVRNVAKTLETLSAQEYVLNSWSYATSRGQANGDAVAKYFGLGDQYGNHYADYANMGTHDYTDDVLRTAWAHSHYVSIAGGTETTKVSSTIGYIDEQGIAINSGYNRMNASLKLQQQLAKNLSLDFDLRYSESNSNGNGDGGAMAYTYRPIDNPLGGVDYTDVSSGFSFGVENIDDLHNPVEEINTITNRTRNRSLRGSAALSWNIIEGLKARSEITFSRGSSRSSYYDDGYGDGEKSARLSRGWSQGWRSLTTVDYSFNLNENNAFSILLGNEVSRSESESSTLEGEGYPDSFGYDEAMGLIQNATTSFSASNSINVPSTTVSFFGRLNYTLNDRYLLTATLRGDGSSKFAPNHRWGVFPAAALAWRIYEEPFMEGTKDWLSNLKLRLSLGTSGADNIDSNLWRETWSSVSSANNNTPINGELGSFYRPDGLLANPDLKWETTVSRNLGIDFGFLNGRINGSMEIYWNTTKDLLMAVPVDNTTGYSYQYQNFGQTSNKGIELSVNFDVIQTKNFRFNVNAIYNFNRNNLDELPDADQYLYSSYWASSATTPTNDFMFIVGKPIGQVRGFVSDGYYTVDDFNYVNGQYVLKENVSDISNAVTATYLHPYDIPEGQTAFPGCVKYKDLDDSGTVDLDDVTNIGELIAKHTGSFSLNFNYKDFDLSANFNWSAGGKIYNVVALQNLQGNEYNGIGRQRSTLVRDAFKAYSVNDAGNLYAVTDPDELRALNANAKYGLPYQQAGIASSDWIEDASYLRLQTLTLGYTLPKALTKKVKIERCRFYLTGNNLFTITGYSGLDPEVNVTPTGQSGFYSSLRAFPTPNMDNGAYPRARTFTLGANITF